MIVSTFVDLLLIGRLICDIWHNFIWDVVYC